jgi:hypothetical protein
LPVTRNTRMPGYMHTPMRQDKHTHMHNHAHTHARTHAHTRTHTNTHKHMHTHTCTHTHTHTHTGAHMHTHRPAGGGTCTRACARLARRTRTYRASYVRAALDARARASVGSPHAHIRTRRVAEASRGRRRGVRTGRTGVKFLRGCKGIRPLGAHTPRASDLLGHILQGRQTSWGTYSKGVRPLGAHTPRASDLLRHILQGRQTSWGTYSKGVRQRRSPLQCIGGLHGGPGGLRCTLQCNASLQSHAGLQSQLAVARVICPVASERSRHERHGPGQWELFHGSLDSLNSSRLSGIWPLRHLAAPPCHIVTRWQPQQPLRLRSFHHDGPVRPPFPKPTVRYSPLLSSPVSCNTPGRRRSARTGRRVRRRARRTSRPRTAARPPPAPATAAPLPPHSRSKSAPFTPRPLPTRPVPRPGPARSPAVSTTKRRTPPPHSPSQLSPQGHPSDPSIRREVAPTPSPHGPRPPCSRTTSLARHPALRPDRGRGPVPRHGADTWAAARAPGWTRAGGVPRGRGEGGAHGLGTMGMQPCTPRCQCTRPLPCPYARTRVRVLQGAWRLSPWPPDTFHARSPYTLLYVPSERV